METTEHEREKNVKLSGVTPSYQLSGVLKDYSASFNRFWQAESTIGPLLSSFIQFSSEVDFVQKKKMLLRHFWIVLVCYWDLNLHYQNWLTLRPSQGQKGTEILIYHTRWSGSLLIWTQYTFFYPRIQHMPGTNWRVGRRKGPWDSELQSPLKNSVPTRAFLRRLIINYIRHIQTLQKTRKEKEQRDKYSDLNEVLTFAKLCDFPPFLHLNA